MFLKYKYLFTWTLFCLAFSLSMPVYATEWYEGGNLHMATLREWRNASQKK